MKSSFFKRLMSLALCLVLVLSCVSVSAFAVAIPVPYPGNMATSNGYKELTWTLSPGDTGTQFYNMVNSVIHKGQYETQYTYITTSRYGNDESKGFMWTDCKSRDFTDGTYYVYAYCHDNYNDPFEVELPNVRHEFIVTVQVRYTIGYSASGAPSGYGGIKVNGGNASNSGSVTVVPNGSVKFEVVSVPGHKAEVDTGGAAYSKSGNTYTYSSVGQNFNFKVTYTPTDYATVTFTQPEGATITVNGETDGSVQVISGINYKVSVAAATGYQLTGVEFDGTSQTVTNDTTSSFTFTAGAKGTTHTVSATTQKQAFTVKDTATFYFNRSMTSQALAEGLFEAIYQSSSVPYTKNQVTYDGNSKKALNLEYYYTISTVSGYWKSLMENEYSGDTLLQEEISGRQMKIRITDGVNYSNECTVTLINNDIKAKGTISKPYTGGAVSLSMTNGEDFTWTPYYSSSTYISATSTLEVYRYYDLDKNSISAPSSVGSYYVQLLLTDAKFYSTTLTSYSDYIPFSITKATLDSIAIPDDIVPVGGGVPVSSVSGYGFNATITWNPSVSTFAYNSEYTATVTLSSDGNCVFDENAAVNAPTGTEPSSVTSRTTEQIVVTLTFKTGKGTITGVSAADYTGTYDGEAHSISVNAPGGATVSYKGPNDDGYVEANPTFKDVGTYTVYYRVEKDNYETVESQATVQINARPVTVSGITAKDKEYDGSANATLNYDSVAFEGLVSGETLTVTATGTFANKDAGESKNVTISDLQLGDDAAAKNYVLAGSGQQTSATANITARVTSVTITSNGGVYGGTITGATAELNDFVAGDAPTVTLTYTGTANAEYNSTEVPTGAGTYTVTATIADGNYKLTDNTSAEFVVSKASVDVPTIKSKPYNGESQTAEIAETAHYTVKENVGGADVGNYNVVLSLKDSNNYKWSDGTETADKTLAFSITIINQDAPAAPTAKTVASSAVELESPQGSGFGKVQYAVSTTNTAPADGWQESPVFCELEKNTTYYFFARYAGDCNHNPAVSTGGEITTLNTYTIKFNTDGGSEIDAITQDYNTTVTAPANPTKEGYTFLGWVDQNSEAFVFTETTTMGAENIELTAKWAANGTQMETNSAYQVVHYKETDDGYEEVTEDTQFPLYGKVGSTVSATAKSYSGYTLNTEMTVSSATLEEATVGDDGALYLTTLAFYYDLNRNTVTFMNGNNEWGSATCIHGRTLGIVGMPVPYKDGSIFGGWYTEDGTFVYHGMTVTSDLTAYARWITVDAGENGNLEITKRDEQVTVIITPNEGYALETLKVGGEDVTDKVSDGKYTFTMPGKDVTVKATWGKTVCPKDDTCPISDYSDADPKVWYHDGVHFCLETELMIGYPNGSFQPDTAASRAMLITMLWRMEGEPTSDQELDFTDVKDDWYTPALRWAVEKGIIKGYGDGTVRPNDAMSREEMVTILYRYADNKEYDVSTSGDLGKFTDAARVSDYAKVPMQWAVGSGIIEGMTTTTLKPESDSTRAQLAMVTMRFVTKFGN